MYDPNLQRWIQRDPIGERGGINLYQFSPPKRPRPHYAATSTGSATTFAAGLALLAVRLAGLVPAGRST